jgi:hypothetical protein
MPNSKIRSTETFFRSSLAQDADVGHGGRPAEQAQSKPVSEFQLDSNILLD